MSIRDNLRKHHHIGRLGSWLAVLALVVSMIGCTAGVDQHELTISSNTGGTVITPGEGTFEFAYGTVVELVAEADANYSFVQWTGDVDTIDDVEAFSTTITIEGDYEIAAEFAFDLIGLVEYDLSISSTAGGSVTDPGEGVFTYDEEQVVNLVAEAAPGFYFVNWTGDVGTIGNVEFAATTIAMYDDYSITANFAEIPVGQFSLNISSTSGGSVTDPGEGMFLRDDGATVDLVAVAGECYEFTGWTGDIEEIDDPGSAITTITMHGNYTITANFALVRYDLAVGSTAGGSVTDPGEGTFTYDCGQVVDLEAVADDYYEFAGWTGDTDEIDDPGSAITTVTMKGNYTITASFELRAEPMVAAGGYHTVGLKSDGTVVATGLNDDDQCEVEGWTDIVHIAAGGYHTVGLTVDGSVVATGSNASGQCDVDAWDDIVQVAAGGYHTVGLKSDGTVVAAGLNDYDQCEVEGWTDIVQVAAGGYHTVALKEDGTVVAVGLNNRGQLNATIWTGIIQVAAGDEHTVGLKDDGSVVAAGWNLLGQCNVTGWADIVQVSAGAQHTIGLKDDGAVVATGHNADGQCNVDGWADIVQVAGGHYHTVALESDGSVVAVGLNDDGQCDVGGWDLS